MRFRLITSRNLRLLLISALTLLGVSIAAAPSSEATSGFVTIQGTVLYDGHPYPGVQVGFQHCVIAGFDASGWSDVDPSTGHYEFQVPAGCRGQAQFGGQAVPALGITMLSQIMLTPDTFTAPSSSQVWNFNFDPYVPLNVHLEDSRGNAKSGYIHINAYGEWPTENNVPFPGGGTATLLHNEVDPNLDLCSDCTLYVPKNSSTTIRAVVSLPTISSAVETSSVLTTDQNGGSHTFTFDLPEYSLVHISGHVKYDGHPYTGVQVGFQGCSIGGLRASGWSNVSSQNGSYGFDIPSGCIGQFQVGGNTVPALNNLFVAQNTLTPDTFTAPNVDSVWDFNYDPYVPLTIHVRDQNGDPLQGSLRLPNYGEWPDIREVAFPGGGTATLQRVEAMLDLPLCSDCTLLVPPNETTTVSVGVTLPAGIGTPAITETVTSDNAGGEATFTFNVPQLNFITISGHVMYDGHPYPGVQVGMQRCEIGQYIASSWSNVSEVDGSYSFLIPEGCQGQFQVGGSTIPALNLANVAQVIVTPSTFAAPSTSQSWDFNFEPFVPISVSLVDNHGNPLTGGIQFGSSSDWPMKQVDFIGGGTATYYASEYGSGSSSCVVCTMLVPKNETTTVRGYINLPGGLGEPAITQRIPSGETGGSATFTYTNWEEVLSQGVNSGSLQLLSASGAVVSDVRVESTTAQDLPSGAVDLAGSLRYTVSGLADNATVLMTFLVPTGQSLTNIYKSINGEYVDVTSDATISGQIVQLSVTDGGLGDEDGVINGAIVDPLLFVHATRTRQQTLTVTSTSGTVGVGLSLTSSGGSGNGAVSYTVANGTARGCQIIGTTLTSTSAGTCKVIATKQGNSTYNLISSSATNVTFTVAQSNNNQGGGGGMSFIPAPQVPSTSGNHQSDSTPTVAKEETTPTVKAPDVAVVPSTPVVGPISVDPIPTKITLPVTPVPTAVVTPTLVKISPQILQKQNISIGTAKGAVTAQLVSSTNKVSLKVGKSMVLKVAGTGKVRTATLSIISNGKKISLGTATVASNGAMTVAPLKFTKPGTYSISLTVSGKSYLLKVTVNK